MKWRSSTIMDCIIKKGRDMFLTMEGQDCCGKSTQIRMLSEYLKSIGLNVWVTKEPTDGPIGKLIREIQKGNLINNPDEATMLYLYMADRIEHQKEIKEHLNNKEIVICDRYIDSSQAYQSFNDNHIEPWQLNDICLIPDITIILDVPVETSLKRLKERGGEPEIFEKEEFLKQVRDNYLMLYNLREDRNIVMIDGNREPEIVFEDIKRILKI